MVRMSDSQARRFDEQQQELAAATEIRAARNEKGLVTPEVREQNDVESERAFEADFSGFEPRWWPAGCDRSV